MLGTEIVLIVDDEEDIRYLISEYLKEIGLVADAVGNARDALEKLRNNTYSLVILDWMLPGVSGIDFLKILRGEEVQMRYTPVLMLTSKADTEDVVLGLETGADDYLTKPFDVKVLRARVQALLRRYNLSTSGEPEKAFEIGNLTIDPKAYEVKCQGQRITLTRSEFRLLYALVQNQGRVLTRGQLISLVQGGGVSVVDRAIDTHVFGLRKKLGACAEVVETVRGVGYRVSIGPLGQ